MKEKYEYYCDDCHCFVDKGHRCQQWGTVHNIPVEAIDAIFKSRHVPKHETVAEWEKRTGEVYPDDGPVWRKEVLTDSKGSYTIHHLTTWKSYKPYGSPEIIDKWLKLNQPFIANHHGKPEELI